MHHCLQIDEILALIFESVLEQPQNTERRLDRPSLVALVKTCRSFNVPAMRLLWRDLPTLAPLFLTMPEDLVEVNGPEQSSPSLTTLTFRRDTSPTDWDRFDFHAPFVREMGPILRDDSSLVNAVAVLDQRICQELKQRDKILLPNLRVMLASNTDMSLTDLLLTPHTEELWLGLHPQYIPSITRLLVDIPICALALKSLHLSQDVLWSPRMKDLLLPALSTSLESLDLEEFKCGWLILSDKMVESLVRMPSLRQMVIARDIAGLAGVLRLFPFPEPRLTEFSVSADSVGPLPLAQILISLQPSLLEAFCLRSIDQTQCCTQDELNALILAIAKHCSPHIFTFLYLDGFGEIDALNPAIVDFKLLRPLFAFSNMLEITLSPYPFDMNDAEIKELAMSWPLLEGLHVTNKLTSFRLQHHVTVERRTTLRSLLWLATYCRNLNSLKFPFDGIDIFSDAEISAASNHQLPSLSVGHSTIPEPDAISAFFKIVFPNLSALSFAIAPNDEIFKMWLKVKANIQDKGRLVGP